MRFPALVVFLCLIAFPASAEEFPHLTCPVVRQFVAEYGKAKALAFALSQGATWRQIMEAKRCLTNPVQSKN